MAKKHKHGTIPRTLAAADKLGLPTVQVDFKAMPVLLRATFMPFSDLGSRDGVICGTMQGPNGPLICYKDANGSCVWKLGDPLQLHEDHV